MLQGNDTIGLRAWLRDLTYKEVHAFTTGLFAGLLTMFGVPGSAILVVLTALVIVKGKPVRKQTAFDPYWQRQLNQLRDELWYYSGGGVLGLLMAPPLGFLLVW